MLSLGMDIHSSSHIDDQLSMNGKNELDKSQMSKIREVSSFEKRTSWWQLESEWLATIEPQPASTIHIAFS